MGNLQFQPSLLQSGPPTAPATALGRGLTPRMLNHHARVTHDVATTADFYIRVLGMELASTVWDDRVPSTGEAYPYFHIFFRMQDGSTLAFFECIDLPARAQPTHPAYDVFDHLAMQVQDEAELQRWQAWLIECGVEVLGPVDHKGMIRSIYFHDPNGYRLELTVPVDPLWNRHTEQAYHDLNQWVQAKQGARERGDSEAQALTRLIRGVKGERYGK